MRCSAHRETTLTPRSERNLLSAEGHLRGETDLVLGPVQAALDRPETKPEMRPGAMQIGGIGACQLVSGVSTPSVGHVPGVGVCSRSAVPPARTDLLRQAGHMPASRRAVGGRDGASGQTVSLKGGDDLVGGPTTRVIRVAASPMEPQPRTPHWPPQPHCR